MLTAVSTHGVDNSLISTAQLGDMIAVTSLALLLKTHTMCVAVICLQLLILLAKRVLAV
jgi:hypothetical protein